MRLFGKYGVEHHYPYRVFMDNLFTTVPLLKDLKINGYHGRGTVRVNRLGKSCPLADTATFKYLNRNLCAVYKPQLLHPMENAI